LEREILPKYPRARIELVRPTIAVLLMNVSTDVAKSQMPDFKGVTHIFLPISDVKDVGKAEGGTHWSLLLVSTLDRVAFHYDSLGSVNIPEARDAARRLGRVLGTNLRFQNIEDCPQQENGNDCGVFVCILMRHLLVKKLLNANSLEKVNMSMANKMIDAHGGRKEMLRIIENLRREGERRRSTSPFARPDVPRVD
jgi:sentrin-specific protease 8